MSRLSHLREVELDKEFWLADFGQRFCAGPFKTRLEATQHLRRLEAQEKRERQRGQHG